MSWLSFKIRCWYLVFGSAWLDKDKHIGEIPSHSSNHTQNFAKTSPKTLTPSIIELFFFAWKCSNREEDSVAKFKVYVSINKQKEESSERKRGMLHSLRHILLVSGGVGIPLSSILSICGLEAASYYLSTIEFASMLFLSGFMVVLCRLFWKWGIAELILMEAGEMSLERFVEFRLVWGKGFAWKYNSYYVP